MCLCLGYWWPSGKCQKPPCAWVRWENTGCHGLFPSCLGLQQAKKAEWAQGDSGVCRKKCSVGFSTGQNPFTGAPPSPPISSLPLLRWLCSLLCSYLGDSAPCGLAKGPLGGSTRGRGRREPPGCWVQGPYSAQQGPGAGKAVIWSLLIQLTTWERNIWQQRQTKKQKMSNDLELKVDISKKQV